MYSLFTFNLFLLDKIKKKKTKKHNIIVKLNHSLLNNLTDNGQKKKSVFNFLVEILNRRDFFIFIQYVITFYINTII